MKLYANYLKPLFFSRRFYWAFAVVIFLFVLSFFFPPLLAVSKAVLFLFFFLSAIDFALLFLPRKKIGAVRSAPERLSNGDNNTIQLAVTNHYPFVSDIQAIDEIPVQFQQREFSLVSRVRPGEEKRFAYTLRPVERGEYVFEDINVFATSPIGLLVKREIIPSRQMVKVYPSYFALRRYELLAWSNQLSESGNRKIRKIGQSVEFEQIKEYVTGDDIRSINWKATARKGGQLMVNNYTDERSQQVYCIIDKGRVMKMPFEGLSLLDYAINSALILSRVALIRQDRAGLLTFADQIGQFLPAGKKTGQMNSILETLYNQQTNFAESDFEKLYALTRTRITQRSLLILFTNFESLAGLQRQLPYIRSMARNHLLLVVFFENTELRELSDKPVDDIEGLYIRTIADKFAYEKRLIIKELQQHGIFTIFTAPENLTINTVNKYLEIKASQAI